MSLFKKVRSGAIPARLTVADVYALQAQGVIDERERFELVEGEIVPMAAASFSVHERMKSELNRALVLACPEGASLFCQASVTLSPITFVKPDLALWPRDIGSQEVRGPDLLLVVEVAVSSIAYDVGTKARLYAAADVADYWVVDAVRRTIRVHRSPVDGRYADVDEFAEDEAVTALRLPGVTIRLDALRG